MDPRKPRDQGRIHADPISAEHAGAGHRARGAAPSISAAISPGNRFADFILGVPFSASRVVGKGVETGRSWWHGYYVQDDWKVSRKLTLNIGLRYEYVSPLLDNLDRRSTFWPLSNDYNTGIAGQVWWRSEILRHHHAAMRGRGRRAAPGRCFPASRLPGGPEQLGAALRFRLFHERQDGDPRRVRNLLHEFAVVPEQLRDQPPPAALRRDTADHLVHRDAADRHRESRSSTPPRRWWSARRTSTRSFKEGYTQHWNLTVQRQFPKNISLEAGYVANKGTNLGRTGFLQRAHSRTHGHDSGAASFPRLGHGPEHGPLRDFHLQLPAGESVAAWEEGA